MVGWGGEGVIPCSGVPNGRLVAPIIITLSSSFNPFSILGNAFLTRLGSAYIYVHVVHMYMYVSI